MVTEQMIGWFVVSVDVLFYLRIDKLVSQTRSVYAKGDVTLNPKKKLMRMDTKWISFWTQNNHNNVFQLKYLIIKEKVRQISLEKFNKENFHLVINQIAPHLQDYFCDHCQIEMINSSLSSCC